VKCNTCLFGGEELSLREAEPRIHRTRGRGGRVKKMSSQTLMMLHREKDEEKKREREDGGMRNTSFS